MDTNVRVRVSSPTTHGDLFGARRMSRPSRSVIGARTFGYTRCRFSSDYGPFQFELSVLLPFSSLTQYASKPSGLCHAIAR
ncbi:hypothetical protein LSTR_LSTR008258 [Laodelphax striatellus]|uniref:Uncharacterized protein n=1 Tax=Laodelphax striatellus TaxID=195883 RepID=A0A482XMD9_LAOST|nr:hypothetical protein LSTR_LSTR008258 [Laodelphax striatellus]